jgi:hypothetical protein
MNNFQLSNDNKEGGGNCFFAGPFSAIVVILCLILLIVIFVNLVFRE